MDTNPQQEVIIYVRSKMIMRGGKRVRGFQAGFQQQGGVTSTDKVEAIEHQKRVARKFGAKVVRVEEIC